MQNDVTSNPFLARLDALCAAHAPPLTRYALATRAGVHESTIRKLERSPKATPRADTVMKLAEALGVSATEIMPTRKFQMTAVGVASTGARADVEDVPLVGLVTGSLLGNIVLGAEPIDWLARPPGLRHVRNAYAVYVENDSMSPMHSRGDLVFVNPDKPPRHGDSVIVQTKNGKGELQAYIKILEKRNDAQVTCRQINPPANIIYPAREVVAVHRVLTTAELFNR